MRGMQSVRASASGATAADRRRRVRRFVPLLALGLLAASGPWSASPAFAQAEYAGQFAGILTGDLSGTYFIVIEADAVSSNISGTLLLSSGDSIPLSGSLDGNAYFSGILPTQEQIFFNGAFVGTDRISGTWSTAGSPGQSGTFDGLRVAENVPEVIVAQALAIFNAASGQRSNFYRRMENLRGGGAGLSTGSLSLDLRGVTLTSDMLMNGSTGLAQIAQALGMAFDSPGATWARRGRTELAGDGAWRGRSQEWTSPPRRGTAASYADESAGGGGSSDSGGIALIPEYGVFLNGTVALSEQSPTLLQGGFDATTFGFSSGIDRRIGDSLVAGAGLGYTRDDTDFNVGGASKSNAVYGVLYGTATPWKEAYVDGVLSVGWIGFDVDRLVAPDVVASGETNGAQIWGGLTGGWNFPFGATTVSPYARLNGGSTWVQDYAESGAGAANLAYADSTIWSLSTVLALRADHAISTSAGVVLPYVRAEYEHEFGDAPSNDVRPLNGSFGTGPISVIALDRNFFNVGGGVSMVFPRSWSGFVDYEGLFGADNLTRHTVTGGVRKEF